MTAINGIESTLESVLQCPPLPKEEFIAYF
jgi:hypothetical protein